MHIGFFTNAYTPTISGVSRSVGCFRKALTGLGHNVFVFAPQTENHEYEEPFVFNYPSVEIPQIIDLPFVIPISTSIDHIFPSLKLDVIHSHHPILLGQTAAQKAERYDLPLVFTFHSLYWEYSRYAGSIGKDFIKDQIDNILCDYLQKCHHIVTPSESLRDMLFMNYGLKDKVTTIPTGVEMQVYDQLEKRKEREKLDWKDEIILISVGRLALEKNWDVLLEAIAIVMRKNHNVRLIILGDGLEMKRMVNKAQSLGIANKVEFPGGIELQDVAKYLTAADIFCFASVAETQGLVTLEAMASGLPIAAVKGSGTRDVVQDGVQGFLSDNNNVSLAAAIEKLIANEELRVNMGEAARERARSFDINQQARKLLVVYEQAVANAARGELVVCNRRIDSRMKRGVVND